MTKPDLRLQNLVPVLDVRDVDESIEFYRSALGFSVNDKVEWGGRTEWALLRSGQVQLMLCASQDDDGQDERAQSDSVFFVYLDDADALHVSMPAQRAESTENATNGRGNGDFYLTDPDGYVLWFSNRPLGRTISGMGAPDPQARIRLIVAVGTGRL